jgi:voltage-gated potassium channel
VPARTKGERWLDRQIATATTPRRAAILIGVATTAITVGAALLMTIIDRDDFPSLGAGLWWATQTVTTVGYGDHVPTTAAGQILAVVVMLLGIGFVTVITASIASSFVSRSITPKSSAADDPASVEHLRMIDERLERIEAALARRS